MNPVFPKLNYWGTCSENYEGKFFINNNWLVQGVKSLDNRWKCISFHLAKSYPYDGILKFLSWEYFLKCLYCSKSHMSRIQWIFLNNSKFISWYLYPQPLFCQHQSGLFQIHFPSNPVPYFPCSSVSTIFASSMSETAEHGMAEKLL